ncbi:hypothetical protein [Amycolatopsis sp. CA-128772]|uniref:hypothetical protein n=1 Tax=Amycolatopsis sp. CA-128772 TaxID=2073159 RepID=UPI001E48240A|nr:hypothetical protein [Amycolatopsis sp. CA-128772]
MPHSFLSHLECSRTGERVAADAVQGLSPAGAPLLARYDLGGVREAVTPKEIAGREPTLWRYHEVLPVRSPEHVVNLGEGMTPLLRLPRYGRGVRGIAMPTNGNAGAAGQARSFGGEAA